MKTPADLTVYYDSAAKNYLSLMVRPKWIRINDFAFPVKDK